MNVETLDIKPEEEISFLDVLSLKAAYFVLHNSKENLEEILNM